MTYVDSIRELLEAQEGEHTQFKEAKNRFDFGEAAKCCCAWQTMAAVNLFLAFQIKDLAVW